MEQHDKKGGEIRCVLKGIFIWGLGIHAPGRARKSPSSGIHSTVPPGGDWTSEDSGMSPPIYHRDD